MRNLELILNKYDAKPFKLVKALLLSEFLLLFVISAQLLNACIIEYMQKRLLYASNDASK